MKSFYLSVLVITGVLVLGACGSTEEAEVVSESPETQQAAEENEIAAEQAAVIDRLEEPDEDTICEYCQMTVYDATHELGAFTAQGIKADGSNAFFDDIGCMLNQERVDAEEMEKFVRDYETLEWIPFEQAVIVKSGLKTPMNYGFAFFKDQAAAEAFIAEQGDAELSDFAAVDVMSHERHEMRMEKMGEGNSHDSHDHSDPEEGTDKMEHGDEDGMKDDGE
ncbi:nitrous oxide reductase accessory protein NosL [Planococcus sp. ISL-109]|uniref:nitrous oxide reductase accessory protein NosL n=1 Tax=Planococcus sp. ISL-109 TaxID=2819166 RepID=UPI001BE5DB73|nr:nitrous oxide reductase accessory protein NosL [Planococcus sp. ISL-109]MBT2583264.1 nitrous oxide reductase accessory protein NosL [Planococcus sp. ISL-109]